MKIDCKIRTHLSLISAEIKKNQKSLLGISDKINIEVSFNEVRQYSILSKLHIQTPNTIKTIFVKMPHLIDDQSRATLRKEYKILCELFNKFRDDTVFNVVKPITFVHDPPALLTEESPGNRLSTILKHGAKLFPSKKRLQSLSEKCKKCGQWLRRFQNVTKDINKQRFIFTEELDFINNQIHRCKKKALLPKQLLNLVREYLQHQFVPDQLQDNQFFGMHADFVHSNILVTDQNITVLDFSNFREGHPLRDVATYLYSLDKFTSNPLFKKKVIDTLKKEFINGYVCGNLSKHVSILKLFQIREILGGLLSFSDQDSNKYRKKLKFKMLQIYSNAKIDSLINEKNHFKNRFS